MSIHSQVYEHLGTPHTGRGYFVKIYYIHNIFLKIASEMPLPHSLGKYFSTPRDIEVVK